MKGILILRAGLQVNLVQAVLHLLVVEDGLIKLCSILLMLLDVPRILVVKELQPTRHLPAPSANCNSRQLARSVLNRGMEAKTDAYGRCKAHA